MNVKSESIYRSKLLFNILGNTRWKFLILWIISAAVLSSCETDPYSSHFNGGENLTICQYLKANQQEYSKSYRLLNKGKMLSALCAYNPYGEDYTLFLPTNKAIDDFIQQNPNYTSFEEMLLDTSFINSFTRYHTVNKGLHTDDFPDGALKDSTLTGDRLTTGFYTDGDNLLIKINNTAPIIQSNLEMTNGYIHVISKVIPQVEISGYEWLQQQDDYSILAEAMEFTKIANKLWWKKYSLLAEHDSIYHKNGIFNLADLRSRVAATGNSIYDFTAFHFIGGEYYLNDLHWGNSSYWTMAKKPLLIKVGNEIRVNPGIDTFEINVSEAGDTTIIDYVRLIREDCNIKTISGPVHSLRDILFFEPLP